MYCKSNVSFTEEKKHAYSTDRAAGYTSGIPEVYMGIVLPKAAGMQKISFLGEEIREKNTLYCRSLVCV